MFVAAFYFSIGSHPVNRRKLRLLFRIWIMIVLLVSIYGFYQVFARNIGLPLANLRIGSFYTVDAHLGGFQRPTSLFREPTYYSAFVLPGYVFFTVIYFYGEAKSILFSSARKNKLVILFFWVNYFFIASLGGFIAIASTAGIAFLIQNKVRRILTLLGALFLLLLFMILSFGQGIDIVYEPADRIVRFTNSIVSLLLGDGQVRGSVGIRITRLYWAFQVWAQNPVFGVGINNIIYMSDLTFPEWYSGRSFSPVTHSILGFLIASTGIIGTISYAWIYVSGYKHLQSAVKSFSRFSNKCLVYGVGYAVLVNFFNGFFSIPIANAQSWFLFALVSILYSYSHESSSVD